MRRTPSPLRLAAVLALALTAACGERPGSAVSPEPTGGPRDAISDGTRALGNPNFFWLPPMLPNPSGSPNFDAGKFVATWKPQLRICRWNGTACVAGAYDRTFTSEIAVSAADEQYQLNWSTRDGGIDVGTYRATVTLPAREPVVLGFVDIVLLDGGGSFKNLQGQDVVPLQDGRTVPIKFRIEQGASVANTTDYFEGTVTDAGGTFATNTGFAGIYLAPGWLPDGFSSVTLTIERVPLPGLANDCHGVGPTFSWLRQREGCYRIQTSPAVGIIQADAIVGVCSEAPTELGQVMVKSDPRPSGGRTWKALENVALPPALAAIINPACGSFSGIASAGPRGFGDRLLDGGRAFASAIGRAISPRPLYALDYGSGGRLLAAVDEFSNFGWVIPATLSVASGSGQDGVSGTALPLPFTVTAREAHAHDGPGATLSGIPVTFSVLTGAGSFSLAAAVSTVTVTTNASGQASVPFLPTGVGPYTVTATIPNDSTDEAFPSPDAPPTRTVSFSGTIATPGPVIDSIRVIATEASFSAPVAANNNLGMLAGNVVSVQVQPFSGGTVAAVTCSYSIVQPPPGTTQYATLGSPGTNSFTVTGNVQTSSTVFPTIPITCGAVTRTLNVFVTVIG